MHFLLNTLSLAISSLSPLGLQRTSRFLSFVFFDVLRLRRALILRNLSRAFPQWTKEEKIRVGRESVFHFVLTLMECLHSRDGSLGRGVHLIGEQEALQEALQHGAGAYILCFHMGNWEAMGAAFTHQVRDSFVVVKNVGLSGVDRFVREMRKRNGFHPIERRKKGDAYQKIQQVLSQGNIVGFVMDQSRPGQPLLNFFGHPSKTNTSLAAIWLKNRAPIFPSYIRRISVHEHQVVILPEISLELFSSDEPHMIQNITQIFNSVVESCVRQCPEQYFWFHDRWKI